MAIHDTAPRGPRATSTPRSPGERAYRRAWWSLALYPVSFVAAFVVGEGLYAALPGDPGDGDLWRPLVAGTLAMLVFVIPGVLAVALGRRAMRLGHSDGKLPAYVGGALAVVFVLLNVVPFAVSRLVG